MVLLYDELPPDELLLRLDELLLLDEDELPLLDELELLDDDGPEDDDSI